MSTELNDKILDIIRDVHCDTDNWGHCGGINRESQKETANAIEALVLQEKIDLLNGMYVNKMDGQENLYDAREDKISELSNRLKQLKAD